MGGVPRYLPAIPHHLRVHDWSRLREGVVVREEPDDERELEQSNGGGGGDDTAVQHATTTAAAAKRKPGKSSLVDVGLLGERVRLDRAVKLGVRVTAGLYNVEFS